ncbi:MAG TPA: DPP IV N-terminal domain-containing protein [Dehalococcoidia bacterium]|nr:DPP IV N-terminal domain-containing protein [Dehalococcoidia bacterium]
MRRGLVLFAALALPALLAACGGDDAPASPRIVYEASAGDITNIYTVDPHSGATAQLTHGARFDGSPAWSPDRRRIIFSSDRDGQAQTDLYVMRADGSDAHRITDTPNAGEYSAKFSHDGRRIAYTRQSEDGWTLWVMQADGSSPQRVAGPYEFVEFPAWTHDDGALYYSAIEQPADPSQVPDRAHIFSVDLASGDVRARIRTAGPDVCPHFSRDGARLTYAAPRPGADDANLEIWAHEVTSEDPTGASDTALTDDPARDDYGNPSPDDRTMVFVSDRDGPGGDLYLMDRDGANVRRLTDTPDLRENVPDW